MNETLQRLAIIYIYSFNVFLDYLRKSSGTPKLGLFFLNQAVQVGMYIYNIYICILCFSTVCIWIGTDKIDGWGTELTYESGARRGRCPQFVLMKRKAKIMINAPMFQNQWVNFSNWLPPYFTQSLGIIVCDGKFWDPLDDRLATFSRPYAARGGWLQFVALILNPIVKPTKLIKVVLIIQCHLSFSLGHAFPSKKVVCWTTMPEGKRHGAGYECLRWRWQLQDGGASVTTKNGQYEGSICNQKKGRYSDVLHELNQLYYINSVWFAYIEASNPMFLGQRSTCWLIHHLSWSSPHILVSKS
jgi:hypothetical protein